MGYPLAIYVLELVDMTAISRIPTSIISIILFVCIGLLSPLFPESPPNFNQFIFSISLFILNLPKISKVFHFPPNVYVYRVSPFPNPPFLILNPLMGIFNLLQYSTAWVKVLVGLWQKSIEDTLPEDPLCLFVPFNVPSPEISPLNHPAS